MKRIYDLHRKIYLNEYVVLCWLLSPVQCHVGWCTLAHEWSWNVMVACSEPCRETSGLLGNAADAVVERTGVSNNYRCGMYEMQNRYNVIFYYYFNFWNISDRPRMFFVYGKNYRVVITKSLQKNLLIFERWLQVTGSSIVGKSSFINRSTAIIANFKTRSHQFLIFFLWYHSSKFILDGTIAREVFA